MIPLGSCTMKLNATAEMLPVTWPEFSDMHPFAPPKQTEGYTQLFKELETWLSEITGYPAISLQPNAGSQGEYAGLLVIRAYHESRGQGHRNTCLIPASAHGTNPASATIAGLKVVPVACDERGNIDLVDLRAKADHHHETLAALMVTYPSTHGVFEETIQEICRIVHEHGGQVYMDGANMNAMVGVARPGDLGTDILHFNLHKTFSVPHGGGGPGAGATAVTEQLARFLPAPVVRRDGETYRHDYDRPDSIGRVRAFYGNVNNAVRGYAYLRSLGGDGLAAMSRLAVVNGNYVRAALADVLEVPYPRVCKHEVVFSARRQAQEHRVRALDIAKRLIDYGIHPPTIYFPLIVPEALMVEPTETESKATLDQFVAAMRAILAEAAETPELVRTAPHSTPIGRLDEVTAARRPVLVWPE
jgi:glycine dehydrogenase subunit 2